MDYEKNYKEALERAEQLYAEDCSAEAKDACEYIFPELAENEDERIRKALIEHFTNYEVCFNDGTHSSNVLAWLEKQKDWKPSEEQVGAVRVAAEIGSANDSWAMRILNGLYIDLKKLM